MTTDKHASDHSPAAPGAAAAVPSRRWPVRLAWGALALLAAGAGAWFLANYAGDDAREFPADGQPRQAIDWRQPDALIESTHLSQLPRDLLKVPLLRDTLTEDFVFYYESGNVDRLGLLGSLRRLVYEHELDWRDELLDSLLDQPAELALWRSPDGRLGHFALRISRGAIARLLEPVAKIAAADSQLSQAGELRMGNWRVGLYRLRYLGRRELLFASHGDQLLVLSSPALALNADDELVEGAAHALERLLDSGTSLAAAFALPRPLAGTSDDSARHRINLGASVLGMGYQRFFPSLNALQFEFADGQWQSRFAVAEALPASALAPERVWRAMPLGASACAALPLGGDAVQALATRLASAEDADVLAGLDRDGVQAGVCWYAQSRLFTPLLVVDLGAPQVTTDVLDGILGRLFESHVGAGEALAAQGRFPVSRDSDADGTLWQRQVGSSYGGYPAGQADAPAQMAMSHFFKVSLARHDRIVVFSLDDDLVTRAQAVLAGRFPALGETLAGAPTSLFVSPSHLAQILETETLAGLPSRVEPVFRNAAQRHLLPRLQAMAQYGSYSLRLPDDWHRQPARGGWRWLPLTWQPVAQPAPALAGGTP